MGKMTHKVLIACEESQTVCKAFRERGFEAYSCDIQEPSGGHPEWHIFQNYKCYGIPHAQLVIADIPYNIGANAYANNPVWYNGGDNKNGESKLAKKNFFNTDGRFKIAEYIVI